MPTPNTRPPATSAFLSRFTSPSKKDKDSTKSSFRSQSSIDSKSMKSEDKKAKKAEAKARTEALALELKFRAQERAAADKRSTHSSRSSNRDTLHLLDDRTAMFGGMMGI